MPVTWLGLLARRGDGGADQAVGAEAEERGDEAELADLADQADRVLGLGPGAAEDDRGRVEGAERALEALVAELVGEDEDAEAGAAQGEVEGLGVDLLGVLALAGVEQQDPGRARGGGGEAAGAVQPAGRPAGGELELGLAVGVGGELVDRRQQQLLDRALQRPQRQALLDRAVGGGLVEALQRGAACRRRWPAPPGAGGRARSPRRCCRSGRGRRAGSAAPSARSCGGCRRCAWAPGSRSDAPNCAECWG